MSFTHVDPFEDTERWPEEYVLEHGCPGFTHVDPFEDTESLPRGGDRLAADEVSPTSIRSRILKGT